MALHAYLYDAEGRDRKVDVSESDLASLGERQLLWIDIDDPEDPQISKIAERLGIDVKGLKCTARAHLSRVHNYGNYSQFVVLTPPGSHSSDAAATDSDATRGETAVTFLVNKQWVLTIHGDGVDFIDSFRTEDRPETMIGALTSQDFAASLLDAHLETYFEEVSHIEELVDRLDEQALINPSGKTILGRMVALRRRVSKLRYSLSLQRGVFYGLSRPDLQVGNETGSTPHFQTLVSRFERAIDEVEHTRDLVVGSFDLFTSRTAQQTNELVKVLTYLTAVIGLCAAVAGVFGMNFTTDIFDSGDSGFYGTVVVLIIVVIGATWFARWRDWL